MIRMEIQEYATVLIEGDEGKVDNYLMDIPTDREAWFIVEAMDKLKELIAISGRAYEEKVSIWAEGLGERTLVSILLEAKERLLALSVKTHIRWCNYWT